MLSNQLLSRAEVPRLVANHALLAGHQHVEEVVDHDCDFDAINGREHALILRQQPAPSIQLRTKRGHGYRRLLLRIAEARARPFRSTALERTRASCRRRRRRSRHAPDRSERAVIVDAFLAPAQRWNRKSRRLLEQPELANVQARRGAATGNSSLDRARSRPIGFWSGTGAVWAQSFSRLLSTAASVKR